MRVVIQRVSEASVTVDKKIIAKINTGLVILLGIEDADDESDVEWLVPKIASLRIFPDDDGVMNKSAIEVSASAIVVSQFTLHALTKKGNRPSYIRAARGEKAIPLYEHFVAAMRAMIPTSTGIFGADMKVALVNDGPVTILIDSKMKE